MATLLKKKYFSAEALELIRNSIEERTASGNIDVSDIVEEDSIQEDATEGISSAPVDSPGSEVSLLHLLPQQVRFVQFPIFSILKFK